MDTSFSHTQVFVPCLHFPFQGAVIDLCFFSKSFDSFERKESPIFKISKKEKNTERIVNEDQYAHRPEINLKNKKRDILFNLDWLLKPLTLFDLPWVLLNQTRIEETVGRIYPTGRIGGFNSSIRFQLCCTQ
jgi:hypothetical protein